MVTPYVGRTRARRGAVVGPTPTTRVVTGLTNGTTYRFRVQAVNAVGTGGLSNITNAVTPVVITVPGAPTLGHGHRGERQATVSWTAPAFDWHSPLTGYTVTGFVGCRAAMVAQTFSSPATIAGHDRSASGTKYKFRVTLTPSAPVRPHLTNTVTPSP